MNVITVAVVVAVVFRVAAAAASVVCHCSLQLLPEDLSVKAIDIAVATVEQLADVLIHVMIIAFAALDAVAADGITDVVAANVAVACTAAGAKREPG